jgi:hypothetical protein
MPLHRQHCGRAGYFFFDPRTNFYAGTPTVRHLIIPVLESKKCLELTQYWNKEIQSGTGMFRYRI